MAEKVAEIWKEYGALAYFEYVGEDLKLEGTRSFIEVMDLKEDEAIVFGWVLFPSKEIRDLANNQVPNDPRMTELVTPLTQSTKLIFDASRLFSRIIVKLNRLEIIAYMLFRQQKNRFTTSDMNNYPNLELIQHIPLHSAKSYIPRKELH